MTSATSSGGGRRRDDGEEVERNGRVLVLAGEAVTRQ